jgi:hypothetical protein
VNYTLWRNGELLGRMMVPFPTHDPDGIFGMLHPTPAYADISVLMQTRYPHLPHAPTVQHRFPLTSYDEAPSHGPHTSVELSQLTTGEARGVAPEAILELHDADGRTVLMDVITVSNIPLPPGEPQGEMFDLCASLGVAFSAWMLAAHRRSPATRLWPEP